MADNSFEPVGVHYTAISPDESVTSAHELSEARFENLIECLSVDNLGALFDAAVGGVGSMAPCPQGWVYDVHEALLGTACFDEHHMNALMQKALTVAVGTNDAVGSKAEEGVEVGPDGELTVPPDGGTHTIIHGLQVEETDKMIQIQTEKTKAIAVGVEKGNQKQKRARQIHPLKMVGAVGSSVAKLLSPRKKGSAKTPKKQTDELTVQDDSSIQGDASIHSPTETVVLLKVKERKIRNVLLDCYGDNAYVGKTKVNGLPLTLESKPDFAAWTSSGMLMTCEGKNKGNFVLDDAIRQSAAYMLIHLFYWLVIKSRIVPDVYGVAVAGAQCNDLKQAGSKFAVVLLRLSLPAQIGKKLVLRKYRIDQSNFAALEDLWDFTNRVCNLKPVDAPQLSHGQGCPGLLQMPSTLLPTEDHQHHRWEMIKNGTANLVFRLPSRESWDDIKPYMVPKDNDFRRWEAKFEHVRFPCILKCKNYLATDDPYRGAYYIGAVQDETPVLADLQSAYNVSPITTGNGVYILVANMGNPIRAIDKDLLASKFLPFMDRVLACQQHVSLVHGDIHTGNVLEDDSKDLRLIDYDEACNDVVTARNAKTDEQKRVYVKMLAKTPEQFTKNQLINLFRLYWRNSKFANGSHSNIDALIEEYDSYFVDGAAPGADTVDTLYDQLRTILERLSPDTLIESTSKPTNDDFNVISASG